MNKYKFMQSHIKNNKNGYTLELPLIKRKFDSIYINYKNSSSVFWDFFVSIFFKNIIFGVSNFWEKYLFYVLDLEKIVESEFIVLDFKFFNINIFNKKSSILVLFLENGDKKIFSSLYNVDFEVFVEKDILIIKNKVLDSVIFEKKLVGNENFHSLQSSKKNNTYTSILDIYFFDNLFIKSENKINFSEEIEKFNFENKKFENKFFPENKLIIFEEWVVKKRKSFLDKLFFKKIENYYSKLELLKKYLLFKNNYNFLLESIDYEDLNEYFQEFNFIDKNAGHPQVGPLQNLFSKINLEKIDNNMINANKQIQDFTMNYYNLEQNYNKIKKINIEYKNSKILEQSKRLEIFKKDLEEIKEIYFKYFKEFLEKVF